MGWRYRRSVKLLPGVRLNFGLHSTSISIGGKGYHKTFSSTGRVTSTIGIPGTGLYHVSTEYPSRQSSRTSSRTGSGNRYHVDSGSSHVAEYDDYEYENQPSTSRSSSDSYLEVARKQLEELDSLIANIYKQADRTIDWREYLVGEPADSNDEEWNYYKSHAEDVLNGNIDTYLKLISELNPLDDLLQYGSQFEFGTDDPRMMSVHFHVNSSSIFTLLEGMNQTIRNTYIQDYVCACAIRIARDMFALLPLRHMIIDAEDDGKEILSVDFDKQNFLNLDFDNLDPSDTVSEFECRMNFSAATGFSEITPIDSQD